MPHYFITGIGTDVGKTIASSILAEALEADYWKPIQSGATSDSDTLLVK
ncbi:MAG TPA: ATP-dependent dethiobiotin synthetase BioD, partial [Bacteroidetes bacterium]|nr:ATP-dependent dethiobiotin synthetase BioD [Bacteroidota bacterium]